MSRTPPFKLDALHAAGAERVYVDYATGATMSRPQLRQALDDAQAGDVLTVWRLGRLGRSMGDLITQVNQLAARGIEFRNLTETIDTTPRRPAHFPHLRRLLAIRARSAHRPHESRSRGRPRVREASR